MKKGFLASTFSIFHIFRQAYGCFSTTEDHYSLIPFSLFFLNLLFVTVYTDKR